MNHQVIPQHLSIKAMRSSGYRDAAHAIAELVDNSIQAGEESDENTSVELICIDRKQQVNSRSIFRINEIAVYDNARGMSPELLQTALQFGVGTHLSSTKQKGMGKFGMGLPNASISQCRHVDVWSWQNNKCYYTYLDITEIENEEMEVIPKPQQRKIPPYWNQLIRSKLKENGTLIVWKELDRVKWKQSKSLLMNAEFLIGRMYRYFINEEKASIRLAAYKEENGYLNNEFDSFVRANDPLYLMKGVNAPEPYHIDPAFDEFTQDEIIVTTLDQVKHKIIIKYSIAKPTVREAGGASSIGKHVAKNLGISIVRAHRELEMSHTFDNHYDPRERWWGIEISFSPLLDDIFGVTNNKQAATAFEALDLQEDAKSEGLSIPDYKNQMDEDNDPRAVMYEISARIRANLSTIRKQIKRQKEGNKTAKNGVPTIGSAEEKATRITYQRINNIGKKGRSDIETSASQGDNIKKLKSVLIETGVEEEQATEIAIGYVKSDIKFLFTHGEALSSLFFDINSKAGKIIITINTNHPAYNNLYDLLRDKDTSDTPALKSLKLMLTAWARMEDEASDIHRQNLEDVRAEWGKIARDFLQ